MNNGAEARAVKALQDFRNAKAGGESDKIDQAADRFNDLIMYVEPDRRDELMAILKKSQ